MNPDAPASHTSPRLWIGIAVIVLGLLMTLDSLEIAGHHFFLKFSPLVLTIVGVVRLKSEPDARNILPYALIVAGIFFTVANFVPADFSSAIPPLLLVLLGIFLVTRALSHSRRIPPELAADQGFVSCTAIFGGCKRRPLGPDFKGAEMTAIFGGVDLDLRQAVPARDQVRVDVFALFGGGEIKVPTHWAVTVKTTAIAGAVEDKTLHLPTDGGDTARPHLVVTGLALFGGVSIQN